jgi:hypothetical protein
VRIVIANSHFLIIGVIAVSLVSKLRNRAGYAGMGLPPPRSARPAAALSDSRYVSRRWLRCAMETQHCTQHPLSYRSGCR